MNVLEFVENHGTEEKCTMKFKEIRDKVGVCVFRFEPCHYDLA
jgi:hypothetical protein